MNFEEWKYTPEFVLNEKGEVIRTGKTPGFVHISGAIVQWDYSSQTFNSTTASGKMTSGHFLKDALSAALKG